MSTYFKVRPNFDLDYLFDGRLASFGVWEGRNVYMGGGDRRCLTDGQNFIVADYWDEPEGPWLLYHPLLGGDPKKILRAISIEFGVEIVFEQSYEHWEPEYRRFPKQTEHESTQEEAPEDCCV